MVLNTRRLFVSLLPAFGVDTVCDVGSMNGAEALAFRRALPRARVLAFEPNPRNFAQMQANPVLRECGIEIHPLAITDFDGEARFHLVKADYGAHHDRRGMSSLYERETPSLRDGSVLARTARLDSVLAREASQERRRIAVWIDVEGKAFEALAGARGVLEETVLLHVEVESEPCIGARQKLHAEVRAFIEASGFDEIATDRSPSDAQFNALYVRRGLPARQHRSLRTLLLKQRARRLAVNSLRTVCPGCVRRWVAWARRPGFAGSP